MEVSGLYTYPIKGGRGQVLNQSPLLSTGMPNDRCWLLVDQKNRFVTQRNIPALAFLQIEMSSTLNLRYGLATYPIELDPQHLATKRVSVWSDTIDVKDLGDGAATFVSTHLGSDLRLCQAIESHTRIAEPAITGSNKVEYFFADAFPYLLISQESLDLLNSKLIGQNFAPVAMDRFRPNLVIKGWAAHAEDKPQTLVIGEKVEMQLAKPCSRCQVIGIDQLDGQLSQEPLKTLSNYRKLGGSKIYFGMYAWLKSGANEIIKLGDSVRIKTE